MILILRKKSQIFFMTAVKGDYTIFLQGPSQVLAAQCKLEGLCRFLMRAGPDGPCQRSQRTPSLSILRGKEKSLLGFCFGFQSE